MRYLIIQQQAGDGCDYSIGCGTYVGSISASSVEEAFDKFTQDNDWETEPGMWEYSSRGEGKLASVWIVPAPELNGHLWEEFVPKMDKYWEEKEKEEREAQELAEFERLKAKLGK